MRFTYMLLGAHTSRFAIEQFRWIAFNEKCPPNCVQRAPQYDSQTLNEGEVELRLVDMGVGGDVDVAEVGFDLLEHDAFA